MWDFDLQNSGLPFPSAYAMVRLRFRFAPYHLLWGRQVRPRLSRRKDTPVASYQNWNRKASERIRPGAAGVNAPKFAFTCCPVGSNRAVVLMLVNCVWLKAL